MGKGMQNKKLRKIKGNGEDQNYGKVGRPKKKKENNEPVQEIDTAQWFNVPRALQMLTLICEKGSLALRYKTGQRSASMDDLTKNKKSEETRKLKQKLKDLKKNCNYDEKKLYLLIENNSENNSITFPMIDQEGVVEDMNKIYKYLDKEFQVTFILILQSFLEVPDLDPQQLAKGIVQKIIENSEQHKMLLNLALIKTNIEDDLDYVLQLANASQGIEQQYDVNEKWQKDDEKIVQWLIAFVEKILSIFKQNRQ